MWIMLISHIVCTFVINITFYALEAVPFRYSFIETKAKNFLWINTISLHSLRGVFQNLQFRQKNTFFPYRNIERVSFIVFLSACYNSVSPLQKKAVTE